MRLFLLTMLSLFASSAFAEGESAMTLIFAAVDFATVATWVGATGVLIIGIRMAFKGIDLGKRGVAKV